MGPDNVECVLAPRAGQITHNVRFKRVKSREWVVPVSHFPTLQSAHRADMCHNKKLAKLMRKPLLSLLIGAEPGHEKIELDRWWTVQGFSDASFVELQDIAECFSTMAEFRRRTANSPDRIRSRSEQRIKQPARLQAQDQHAAL